MTATDVPLGHSIPAHRVHGWCSHCPQRSLAEEVAAWQIDAEERHMEEEGGEGPFAVAVDWQKCPDCGDPHSLSVVQVTVRTTTGIKRAGGWVFCLNCESVPQEAAHAGS
ncbi:hypothetical protein VSR01_17160 [Actinacidiphila sp. DG2A-62]|uniref:hypothetical protein n=1 Tax=Actinacidiphila sp. DG2A-62 TaxID=3108821 RepID=UPI002DBB2AF9|nr:hypothetical protein [Actinacidiphila sp. DG2A-62]MEC3995168.1 hypothetical protein [Actinacidiphila sp. DG2A-62]